MLRRLLGGRAKQQAPNAVDERITTYGIDPNGAAIFHGLAQRAGLELTMHRAVVAGPAFSGWAQAPQTMRGMAC